MTLEQLIELQHKHVVDCKAHLLHFDESGFHLAHTDEERNSGMDLHDCDLHRKLDELGRPPDHVGRTYLALPLDDPNDPTSQSFRSPGTVLTGWGLIDVTDKIAAGEMVTFDVEITE